jgi:hypothetical protein
MEVVRSEYWGAETALHCGGVFSRGEGKGMKRGRKKGPCITRLKISRLGNHGLKMSGWQPSRRALVNYAFRAFASYIGRF